VCSLAAGQRVVRSSSSALAAPAFRYIDGITMLDKALLVYTSGTTGLPKVTTALTP
jgi:acyl-coenzyme A synthetase/AMP-(fatty) acid ligase